MERVRETFITKFLKLESSSGIMLMIAAGMALILANSPLNTFYAFLTDIPLEIRFGSLEIAKPLLLWINDGFMAVFFFLIGLELKRELIEGELSNRKNIVLPGVGAIGGMLVPALVYTFFNWGDAVAMKGWAIPAATDIAFALGILSLLGSRVSAGIKVFLTSLAIFDDIGAILIIALFYTSDISLAPLGIVAGCIVVLALINQRNIEAKSIYVMIGIVMWTAMLKSGVHATLTGVLLAMFIPMKSKNAQNNSPLKSLEHDLHFAVAYIILPIFAFANSGLRIIDLDANEIFHPVPLGIMLALFLGNQLGVFGFCWLAIKAKATSLPKGMSWSSLYGTAVLCGIGFTMSLFIGTLAFNKGEMDLLFDERLGIIIGSLASGVAGYLILRRSLR